MNQQALAFEIQPLHHIFELFDIWQPQRMAEETGLPINRIKYLAKLRRGYVKNANSESNKYEIQLSFYHAFVDALHVSEPPTFESLIPKPSDGDRFRFVDLFAGIGGIRKPFDEIGGECVLTCEWDEYAQKTYKANWGNGLNHRFVSDIKSITQSEGKTGVNLAKAIDQSMPDHDVLLAGFPCQPFSIAGVSKKNALKRAHGFECKDQGQLFFDICRVLSVKQPPIAILENVKNLKSHDKGTTFKVIKEMLTNLPEHQKTLFEKVIGVDMQPYWIANLNDDKPDPKVIDGKRFIPQHRERVVLVCIRADIVAKLNLENTINLNNIKTPRSRPSLEDVLEPNDSVDEKYTLTPRMWVYLENYAKKHKAKGNGFGFGMVTRNKSDVTRTLSARYYKDGSEVLINQDDVNKRPRRMTPQECARLMGFVSKKEAFSIPVSDTRAYKQFGNSVVVPVFRAVAELIDPHINKIVSNR